MIAAANIRPNISALVASQTGASGALGQGNQSETDVENRQADGQRLLYFAIAGGAFGLVMAVRIPDQPEPEAADRPRHDQRPDRQIPPATGIDHGQCQRHHQRPGGARHHVEIDEQLQQYQPLWQVIFLPFAEMLSEHEHADIGPQP
ncbi:hypothetical protein [Sphingopyxis sp. BSNA05]|uniref:hypothetical protein n=1 Tax=Sphingopyxis sp. BSNA05 TaxID=1236614 RepID=UPI0020B88D55|nr:hypothetical protein [Sphingopyxis sp. BSNA05]